MNSYKATTNEGATSIVSAYTESEARQKAEDELGQGQVTSLVML